MVGATVDGAGVAGALVLGTGVAGALVVGAGVAGALVVGAGVTGALVVGAGVAGAFVVGTGVADEGQGVGALVGARVVGAGVEYGVGGVIIGLASAPNATAATTVAIRKIERLVSTILIRKKLEKVL